MPLYYLPQPPQKPFISITLIVKTIYYIWTKKAVCELNAT